jgi:hypothetical protein
MNALAFVTESFQMAGTIFLILFVGIFATAILYKWAKEHPEDFYFTLLLAALSLVLGVVSTVLKALWGI